MGIDYAFYNTRIPKIILNVFKKNRDELRVTFKKGWLGWETFSNSAGIDLFFKRNRFGEFYDLMIGFSPHLQINNGLHNANHCSFKNSQKMIEVVLTSLGIERKEFAQFRVSSIEIGCNIYSDIGADEILQGVLMFDKYFYKTHDKYRHYRFARPKNDRTKYLKSKMYIKSEQIDNATGLKYYELGYCSKNIVRIEIKLERADKFNFIDFGNLESLFKVGAERAIRKFFFEHYSKIFFFRSQHIVKKSLSKVELKHYHQWGVSGFWQTLDTRKLTREKLVYSKMPKKYDLKSVVHAAILKSISPLKYVVFPTGNLNRKMLNFLPYKLSSYTSAFKSQDGSRGKCCIVNKYVDIGKATIISQLDLDAINLMG